jgi:hypothetical protein
MAFPRICQEPLLVAGRTRLVDPPLRKIGTQTQIDHPPAPNATPPSQDSCDHRKRPPDLLRMLPGKRKARVRMRCMSTRVLIFLVPCATGRPALRAGHPACEESHPGSCVCVPTCNVCGPANGACAPACALCVLTSCACHLAFCECQQMSCVHRPGICACYHACMPCQVASAVCQGRIAELAPEFAQTEACRVVTKAVGLRERATV